ncbi:low temperature requirement protein LtrA [Kineococcus xinjiangensis]|uniref:Low temperature requirement protein LtrA n=1 Tax=Kineococcus xinjiangensis TaxID=512762 RepID=A0A2S6ISS6_9ACTN|nr:low temperature requirement protein A [Kineococcus xinjiangensis]PPK97205.1 low temperature requirement protein LtrA [Kineococcus xinjiangensis]
MPGVPLWRRVRGADESHRVTTLELFFDLVFVFGFTQVTALMAADLSPVGALRGLVLLALLWWAWSSYSWLGNQAHADEGAVRLTMIAAMGVMFVVALSIPESFSDMPGGVPAPVVFALGYGAVRFLHLGCYLVAAGGDRGLRRQVLVTAGPVAAAVALLVAGALAGPPFQLPLWALALLVDYGGIWVAGTSGWRLPSPVHFAERHGLILIVALGESLMAIGVGVTGRPLTPAVLAASLAGVAVAVCLWWLYFDVVAHVAEGVLASAQGEARSRLARDSYTYLHFPMVVSVIFIALGMKKVLQYVSDSEHHTLADALTGLPLIALYGGVALHLLAHVAFRRRNIRTWNPHRSAAAALLLLLLPAAWFLPALASLVLVAVVLVALVTYEVVRFGDARARVRGAHSAPAH